MTQEGYYEEHDLMPYKKYRGTQKTVKWVIMFDSQYISWLIENTGFVLSNDAYRLYEKHKVE